MKVQTLQPASKQFAVYCCWDGSYEGDQRSRVPDPANVFCAIKKIFNGVRTCYTRGKCGPIEDWTKAASRATPEAAKLPTGPAHQTGVKGTTPSSPWSATRAPLLSRPLSWCQHVTYSNTRVRESQTSSSGRRLGAAGTGAPLLTPRRLATARKKIFIEEETTMHQICRSAHCVKHIRNHHI